MPQDPLAIQYFYEGAPAGTPIPWDAWVTPLAAWSVLIVAVCAVMFASMVILRGSGSTTSASSFPWFSCLWKC